MEKNRLSKWGWEHPKSLWQTVALPNFVEGEVIDVEKTLEVLLAFGKLGLNGVYIKLKAVEGEIFVKMDKFITYLTAVKGRPNYGKFNAKFARIYVYDHYFSDGRRWSLQIEGGEPTWDLTSYKVSPYLNIKMIKDEERTAMYVTNFNIIQEDCNGNFNTLDGHEYITECDTLENAKASIKDVIWQSIELDGLTGNVMIEVSHEHQGEYVDGDTFTIRVDKVVHTDEPSKFVNWGAKKPHIFTVDRKQSVVIYEDTNVQLEI